MNFRKLQDHSPKQCTACTIRTAIGRYVRQTRTTQAWFCNPCALKKETKCVTSPR